MFFLYRRSTDYRVGVFVIELIARCLFTCSTTTGRTRSSGSKPMSVHVITLSSDDEDSEPPAMPTKSSLLLSQSSCSQNSINVNLPQDRNKLSQFLNSPKELTAAVQAKRTSSFPTNSSPAVSFKQGTSVSPKLSRTGAFRPTPTDPAIPNATGLFKASSARLFKQTSTVTHSETDSIQPISTGLFKPALTVPAAPSATRLLGTVPIASANTSASISAKPPASPSLKFAAVSPKPAAVSLSPKQAAVSLSPKPAAVSQSPKPTNHIAASNHLSRSCSFETKKEPVNPVNSADEKSEQNKNTVNNGAGYSHDLQQHGRSEAIKRASSVESPLSSKKQKLQNNSKNISGKKLFSKFLHFISTHLDVSAEEETRLLNRVERCFNEADPDFVESKEFRHVICDAVKKIKSNKSLIFTYIEDVRKELKFRERRVEPTAPTAAGDVPTQVADEVCGAEPKPCSSGLGSSQAATDSCADRANDRRLRLITKLEKLLCKLDERIHKLQEKELSIDELNDSDSAYVREDLLKRKFVKVWNLLCKTKKCSTNAGREVQKKYRYTGTVYNEINEEVEKLINRRRIFPNYCDILEIVQTYCDKSRLKMPFLQMQKLAEEIFSNVGNDLKKRRLRDDQDTLGSYLLVSPQIGDPADEDETLKKLLEDSAVEGEKKIQDVINHFVDKQIELKLEPTEVPENQSSLSSESEEEPEGAEDDLGDGDDEKNEVCFDSEASSGNSRSTEPNELNERVSDRLPSLIQKDEIPGPSRVLSRGDAYSSSASDRSDDCIILSD